MCVGWPGSGDGPLSCRLSQGVVGREAGSISPAAPLVFAEEVVGLAESVEGSRARPEIPL